MIKIALPNGKYVRIEKHAVRSDTPVPGASWVFNYGPGEFIVKHHDKSKFLRGVIGANLPQPKPMSRKALYGALAAGMPALGYMAYRGLRKRKSVVDLQKKKNRK
jgi:hypothetical protein